MTSHTPSTKCQYSDAFLIANDRAGTEGRLTLVSSDHTRKSRPNATCAPCRPVMVHNSAPYALPVGLTSTSFAE